MKHLQVAMFKLHLVKKKDNCKPLGFCEAGGTSLNS